MNELPRLGRDANEGTQRAAKPCRFKRLQSALDKLMKTKGATGTVKSFMKENAT
jgi:hypothetical protein